MGDSAAGDACRIEIASAGFANRGPGVAARERGLVGAMVQRLRGEGLSEPDDDPTVGVGELDAALAGDDVDAQLAAAFLVGRCRAEDSGDDERLTQLTADLLASLDASDLGSRALIYVEAAMSLALRGDVDTGRDALRVLVADGAPGTMADWLAAYYLAQMDDPSGWPAMVRMVEGEDGFTRLATARHLVGFLPYDGQEIGGERVDVLARLESLLDDEDDLVADEVPELLLEAGGDDVRSTLQRAAKKARHKSTRRAAKHAIEHLDG